MPVAAKRQVRPPKPERKLPPDEAQRAYVRKHDPAMGMEPDVDPVDFLVDALLPLTALGFGAINFRNARPFLYDFMPSKLELGTKRPGRWRFLASEPQPLEVWEDLIESAGIQGGRLHDHIMGVVAPGKTKPARAYSLTDMTAEGKHIFLDEELVRPVSRLTLSKDPRLMEEYRRSYVPDIDDLVEMTSAAERYEQPGRKKTATFLTPGRAQFFEDLADLLRKR